MSRGEPLTLVAGPKEILTTWEAAEAAPLGNVYDENMSESTGIESEEGNDEWEEDDNADDETHADIKEGVIAGGDRAEGPAK